MKFGTFGILLAACVLSLLFTLPATAGEQAREPEPQGCITDANCPLGQVCEPTDVNCATTSRQCVPGCRVGARSCGGGMTCLPAFPCVTCPCPDRCEYVGIDPGGDDPMFRVVDGSNGENPYDRAGQLHNAGLDAAIQLRDEFDGDIRSFAIATVKRMREFACAASGEEPCYGRMPGLRVARSLARPEQFQAEIAEALGEARRPYFESLMTITRDSEAGVDDQIARLRELEAEMQVALSEEDAAPLLQAASVARHSLTYWHGEAQGDSRWNLDPKQVDDASFDDATSKLAAFDAAGGFVPYPPYYDPVQGAIASVWAIVMILIHLFI